MSPLACFENGLFPGPAVTKRERLSDPFVVAGPRAYLIGRQDSLFPRIGDHIPGAMWGLWAHPHKLLQGLRLGIGSGGEVAWLLADTFTAGPWWGSWHMAVPDWIGLAMTVMLWVPDGEPGVVVEAILEPHDRGSTEPCVDALWLAVQSDLRPGWLDTSPRGADRFDGFPGRVIFQSDAHPWWVAAVAEDPSARPTASIPGDHGLDGDLGSVVGALVQTLSTPHASRVVRWYLTGDRRGLPPAIFPSAVEAWRTARRARCEREAAWSRIALPDGPLDDALRWTRHQVDWLVRQVPEQGTGLGAGLPEYPWWFACDNFYALPAAAAFGRHALAEATLNLLVHASDTVNGNGRIIHEQSTTGVVYNPGNHQEAPQFCRAVWDVYRWTGHEDWLRVMYPKAEAAMAWVLGEDPTGRGLAPGYGLIEIDGLNGRLIDTAVHTADGLRALAAMAERLGYRGPARTWAAKGRDLSRRILDLYWIPEARLFGDVLAPPGWIRERLAQWSERARTAGRMEAAARLGALPSFARGDDESVLLMGNWVINSPMAAGIAPRRLAVPALQRMRQADFHGPHGLYLSAAEQTASMTISTGVQAWAEAQYGLADEALRWMAHLGDALSLRMPGSITEMSPDGGCFVQAWTAYGAWVPVVQGFFGIDPDAGRRAVTIHPAMPSSWTDAALDNVRIGDNALGVHFERVGSVGRCTVTTREPWRVCLGAEAVVTDVHHGTPRNPRCWDLAAGGRVTFHSGSTKHGSHYP